MIKPSQQTWVSVPSPLHKLSSDGGKHFTVLRPGQEGQWPHPPPGPTLGFLPHKPPKDFLLGVPLFRPSLSHPLLVPRATPIDLNNDSKT